MGNSRNLVGVRLRPEFLEKMENPKFKLGSYQEIMRAALYLYLNLDLDERLRWQKIYFFDNNFPDSEPEFDRNLLLAENSESGIQRYNSDQREFMLGSMEKFV